MMISKYLALSGLVAGIKLETKTDKEWALDEESWTADDSFVKSVIAKKEKFTDTDFPPDDSSLGEVLLSYGINYDTYEWDNGTWEAMPSMTWKRASLFTCRLARFGALPMP